MATLGTVRINIANGSAAVDRLQNGRFRLEFIADTKNPVPLPLLDIEEPTVKVTFGINTSPVAGQEGDYCTARQIQARLKRDLVLGVR